MRQVVKSIKEWISEFCLIHLRFIDNRTTIRNTCIGIPGLIDITLDVLNIEPFKVKVTHRFTDDTVSANEYEICTDEGIVVFGISKSSKVFWCPVYSNYLSPGDLRLREGCDGDINDIDYVPINNLGPHLNYTFRSHSDPFPRPKILLVNKFYR